MSKNSQKTKKFLKRNIDIKETETPVSTRTIPVNSAQEQSDCKIWS